jgi:tetratricopeptide (TPR) repeat protein
MDKKNGKNHVDGWLEQAYPAIHYLVLALESNERALAWLDGNSKGVATFSRALTGHKKAVEALADANLSDLFEILDNDDLSKWLAERRPELHLLFGAIQGDANAVAQLKRKRPARARLAAVVRELHEKYRQQARADNHDGLDGEAAADVGCLIGEMHLSNGAYDKAVEAFTRALEVEPAADLYEGRARAYRGLADNDDHKAADLRRQR